MATYMTKASILANWDTFKRGPLLEVMDPTPATATGSTYGANQIRISGNPEFVTRVMALLKELQVGENVYTRLAVSMATVEPTTIKGERKSYDNAARGAIVAYIQLHERDGAALRTPNDAAYLAMRPGLAREVEEGKKMWDAMLGRTTGPEADRLREQAYAAHGLS